jgi:hypothetical protein
MNQTLIRMAQRAEKDVSLLASFISQYRERKGLSWDEVARQLHLDAVQLARLALCHAPRKSCYSEDISQIAAYVGMDHAALKRFLHPAEELQRSPTLAANLTAFTNGAMALFRRQTWVLGVATMVLMVMGAVAFAQPKRSEATLVVSAGRVTVVQSRVSFLVTSRGEKVVSAGQLLTVNAGDALSLEAGATAQLRLVDGSTVDLFENTTLQVADLYTTEDSYQVRLHMMAGKTLSRVIRVLGAGDAFEISTPSSTASVRGTVFIVEVISPDTTYISCDEGVVHVETGAFEADVTAGTDLLAVAGQPLVVKPQTAATPPGPPIIVPGNPPEPGDTPPGPPASGDAPPGPPASVPGNPPQGGGDVPPDPATNNPAGPPGADDIDSTGDDPADSPDSGREPPSDDPAQPPDDDDDDGAPPDPPGKSRDKPKKVVPVGPPEQVPGKTPSDPPGQGTPPLGGGDPPGNGPPEQVPGNPPPDPPGQGSPPAGGGESPGGETSGTTVETGEDTTGDDAPAGNSGGSGNNGGGGGRGKP